MLIAGPFEAQDEGTKLADVDTIDAVGAGVTATASNRVLTLTIPGGGAFTPSTTVELYDEFMAGSANIGALNWTSGGNTPILAASSNAHPGLRRIHTGAGTTTLSAIYLGSGVALILVGGGILTVEGCFELPALSDGTDEYDAVFGIVDAIDTTGFSNGVYFRYDRNTSTQWLRCTQGAGTTETASGVVVATGFHRYTFVVNAAASSAEFFIDGVSVGTNSTNLPSGGMFPIFAIEKSAGTTQRNMNIDYFYLTQALTTPR